MGRGRLGAFGRTGGFCDVGEYPEGYVMVGVVAAAVSAGTAAYVFWSRNRRSSTGIESVDSLLDRCHDQMRVIEQRLGEFPSAANAA